MFICIHAHHSNQKWMDAALPGESLQHIVIENLLACTERLQVERRVFEQLESLCENQNQLLFLLYVRIYQKSIKYCSFHWMLYYLNN